MIEYIDIHAHLDFEQYDKDRDEVVKRIRENNVAVINIGTTLETSKKALEVANLDENFYAIVGFHPLYVDDRLQITDDRDFDELEKLIQDPKCVGIGECGLDFFRLEGNPASRKASQDRQEKFFRKQIELAIKYDKPLMIHCRAAYPETIAILEEYSSRHPREGGGPGLRVNFHFFTEDLETAKKILGLGFQFSFTGVITFAKEYEELVKFAPMDKIMSETDSPFVAPKSHRGERNEPTYVIEVVEKIAELKGLPLEEVKSQILKNAEEFFEIDF
jgi:TatD DNase family protein